VKRSKEVQRVSYIVMIFRVFTNIIIAIITALEHKPAYFVQLWLPRILSTLLHVFLLSLGSKYPSSSFILNIHGPGVLISQLSNLIWYTGEKIIDLPYAMTTSLSSLFFMLMCAYIMNGGWLVTSAAIVFQTTSTLAFYAYMYDLKDTTCLSIICMTIGMLLYSTHRAELQGKMEFLNMVQIRRMNEDLRNILEFLPEGVVLIDDQSKEVSMGNREFLKMFKCGEFNNGTNQYHNSEAHDIE
jgi:hypothetical protein